jgi:hypothetical protein
MRAKVEEEGNSCRVCARMPADAAHLASRARVKPGPAEDPRNCVPLCRSCHRDFDERRLDLLPYLDPAEQAYCVELLGLVSALERLTGARWAPASQ